MRSPLSAARIPHRGSAARTGACDRGRPSAGTRPPPSNARVAGPRGGVADRDSCEAIRERAGTDDPIRRLPRAVRLRRDAARARYDRRRLARGVGRELDQPRVRRGPLPLSFGGRVVTIVEVPDAIVRFVDSLPESLDGAIPVGPYSQARPGALLRVVPGIGRFLASGGMTIEVFVEEGADPDAVDALIHGGLLGALIHQRGDLPLHASTLVSPDRRRTLAIAGDTGSGKSTTAYELIRRGWKLLSDDLTRVTIENGFATAWPGRTRLRLMSDRKSTR